MSKNRMVFRFKIGYTNVHDEDSGRSNLVTDELVMKINDKVHKNRHFTIAKFVHSPKFLKVWCIKLYREAWLPQILC